MRCRPPPPGGGLPPTVLVSSRLAILVRMDDHSFVTCPFCGEEVEIYIEPDVRGTFVQDCEVCCNPWRVRVSWHGAERDVEIARADGSE